MNDAAECRLNMQTIWEISDRICSGQASNDGQSIRRPRINDSKKKQRSQAFQSSENIFSHSVAAAAAAI